MQVLKTANSYDQLFGLTPSAGSGFGSLSLTADLKVAPSNPKGGTDRKPMTVVASNPAAMRLIDQSRHSLVREWIARRDVVWGAYGVAPDLYGGTESDGFQENLNSGVSAAMAWGWSTARSGVRRRGEGKRRPPRDATTRRRRLAPSPRSRPTERGHTQ